MGRDANHETIALAFRRAGAYTIDLSKLGRDVPDLLVGFAQTERLVEIKTDGPERPTRERLRPSYHCASCGKTFQSHKIGPVRFKHAKTGEPIECWSFVMQLVPARAGRLSKGQEAFAMEWPGSPVAVVRTKDDVGRVLGEMVASNLARKRGDAR